ncbi:hypothetical protein ACSHWC_03240 [Pseudomonas fluorescens]
MSEAQQHRPKNVLRQVVGWVLVLPLLLAFIRLPFPFGLLLALAAIAASAYGVMFARRHASRGVTVFALIVMLLNVVSLIGIGEASVLRGLYRVFWVYWYPYYAEWVYWNL